MKKIGEGGKIEKTCFLDVRKYRVVDHQEEKSENLQD